MAFSPQPVPNPSAIIFYTNFHAPIEKVFDTIIDLESYHTWLQSSTVYDTTATVSDVPIRVGTTYTEPSPLGTWHGRVTELEAPSTAPFGNGEVRKVVFDQVVKVWVWEVKMKLEFRVWEEENEQSGNGKRKTVVQRMIYVKWPFLQGVLGWFLDGVVEREARRTMEAMRVHLESGAGNRDV